MDKFFKKPSNDKKEMTYEKACELIDEWGEDLEVRLIEDDFQDVKNEIWKAVQKERLTYDSNEEIFTYVFKKPITDKEGNALFHMIKIHETPLEEKRGMTKKKDDIDTLAAMFQAYCKDSEMKEIPHGFLTRIKDRDSAIISAVILGFFVQAVPGKKSMD